MNPAPQVSLKEAPVALAERVRGLQQTGFDKRRLAPVWEELGALEVGLCCVCGNPKP